MESESVRPGINIPFLNDDPPEKFLEKFEVESREIFVKRKEIVDVLNLEKGMVVVDIGAGTGVFMEPLWNRISPNGTLFVLETAPKFIPFLEQRRISWNLPSNEIKILQVNEKDVNLPENYVDVIFGCDVYHHFEYPQDLLSSLHKCLKPNGVLILLDFEKIDGKSTEWVMGHVRCDKQTAFQEITSAKFELLEEFPGGSVLQDNWIAKFKKV